MVCGGNTYDYSTITQIGHQHRQPVYISKGLSHHLPQMVAILEIIQENQIVVIYIDKYPVVLG